MNEKRRTKIICTIGPATESYESLEKLANLGMNVARINLSHGPYKYHEHKVKAINELNEKRREKIAILLDTRGPEIRTGKTRTADKIPLLEGNEVTVVNDNSECTANHISMAYPGLEKSVKPKSKIYMADGNFELEVVEIKGKEIKCKVRVGGDLGSNKNVCIPDADNTLPTLSESDLDDIRNGAKNGADFVAQSFVRGPHDVLKLTEFLQEHDSDAHVIAKIELASAVQQIDQIIAASDGIMVARGDLGVQMPIEKIPAIQKMIVRKCNNAGKPVIVATHMLESMTSNPRPTRAEATDVANAVFDGADCVMLSGETAAGKHPFKAVQTMSNICVEAEAIMDSPKLQNDMLSKMDISTAIGQASCKIADDLGAEAIITPTIRGFTARRIAQQRPKARIIGLTPKDRVAKKLSIVWGVHPLVYATEVNDEHSMTRAVDEAKKCGHVKDGDLVVVTGGVPLGLSGSTNTIHVQRVGHKG